MMIPTDPATQVCTDQRVYIHYKYFSANSSMNLSRYNNICITRSPYFGSHGEHWQSPPDVHYAGTYRVTLELNESAQKLKFTAMIYNLEIMPEHITLVAADSGAEIAQWSYRQIRTYGKSSGKFNFECGRLAKTGPGSFVFKTTCAKEIFGVVHQNIKRIRRVMEEEAEQKKAARKPQAVTTLPKQPSLPEQSQPPPPPVSKPSAADSVDYRTHQPMKPIPYKPKKKSSREEPSLSVGTYR